MAQFEQIACTMWIVGGISAFINFLRKDCETTKSLASEADAVDIIKKLYKQLRNFNNSENSFQAIVELKAQQMSNLFGR